MYSTDSILYLYVKAGWLKIFADKGIYSKSLKTIAPEGRITMILVQFPSPFQTVPSSI